MHFIKPGDRVLIGQGSAEPQVITRLIVEQQKRLPPGVTLFVGPVFTEVFSGIEAGLVRFESYGALGTAAALARDGRLDILPIDYGRLCSAFASGEQKADVVMIAAGPARADGRFGAGISNDFAYAALPKARTVLLEVNPSIPWTYGNGMLDEMPVALCVEGGEPPPYISSPVPSAVERRIASRVAGLVSDRSTIQMGMGVLPAAVMAELAGHKDLGLHTGIMSDGAVDLIQAGAITNAYKEVKRGISITNALFGLERLYEFARDRPEVEVHPAPFTHSIDNLSRISRFTAINGCTEVDLDGQINTETANGRFVGALGGMLEFTRGAGHSAGGRAIIALRSTTGGGRISRIVPRVGTVTIPRADADTIVTEHGVAELRGVSLRERARRLVAIADPAFREGLSRTSYQMFASQQ